MRRKYLIMESELDKTNQSNVVSPKTYADAHGSVAKAKLLTVIAMILAVFSLAFGFMAWVRADVRTGGLASLFIWAAFLAKFAEAELLRNAFKTIDAGQEK